MKQLAIESKWMLVLGIAAAIGVSGASASAPCKQAKFETKLVGDACSAGGLEKAKDAMKQWVKTAKARQGNLECASCHAKMAPTYELKPSALDTFKKLGGL